MKRNFFTFEQIGEDYALYAEDIRRGTPTAVFGVSDSLKYLLAGLTPFPVVYVTVDSVSAKKAAENISSLSGKKVATIAAKDEVLLYRKALSKDSLFARIDGIYALQQGAEVVTAEIDALLQLFPKKLPTIVLKEGEEIDSVFLLKTDILPNNVNSHSDREDFINVIKMLLDKVYSVSDIKEYEKQHQEHVFLRLMDMLNEGNAKHLQSR